VTVPLWAWIAVIGVIVVIVAVDLLVHRKEHVPSVGEAALWSALWVGVGVGFTGVIAWAWGAQPAVDYVTGYVIEKSLSVDNVVVFATIFAAFAVPRAYQHRVLFFGVIGALLMRAAMSAVGAELIGSWSWVLYLFGAFLLWTGWRMIVRRGNHSDPTQPRTVRAFRRFVPMTDELHGTKFWIRRAGALVATPLLLVLVLVEVSDLVFAVDSIPAVFAVTQEPFLVFTSNAFAILGLRALYFMLADLVHRFVYLTTGLGVVLLWVGAKMLLLDVWHVPTSVSLGVVATVITVAVVASLRSGKTRPLTTDSTPLPTHQEGASR
jgi:tellurite resistance protein TerC